MASIQSKVKTVKQQVLKMLSAGLASEFIAKSCNVSPTMVKEWEEEYLRDLLASGAGQRARLRHLLLRNSPMMINTIYKMAQQDIDSKLQMQAATTFLSFASRFLKEDSDIARAEAKAFEAASGNVEQTLFDFVIPGEATNQKPIASSDNETSFFEAEDEDDEEWELTPEDLENSATSTNSDE